MSQWGASVSGSSTFNTNLWTHFCVVNYGNTWEIWINGRLLNSGTMTTTPTRHKGRMGAQNITPLYSFLGQLDDFILFSTALTANEVLEIYRLGRGYGVFPEPDFDEGFGAAGFKAYWARRQSQLIGGGV